MTSSVGDPHQGGFAGWLWILHREPAARVLIWVGYGHAWKRAAPRMMAQYLWEIAREEPFSAYQQTRAVQQRGVDVVIRHPEPRYERGRPDWLRSAERRSVQGAVEPPGEYLVQLHLAAEGPSGTPVDQLLTGADGLFALWVPPGDYLPRVWSADERVVEARPLVVQRDVGGLQLRGRPV